MGLIKQSLIPEPKDRTNSKSSRRLRCSEPATCTRVSVQKAWRPDRGLPGGDRRPGGRVQPQPKNSRQESTLVIHCEAGAAIRLPACFCRVGAEGLLFAIADHPDAGGSHPGTHESLFDGFRPILTEPQIIFIGTTLVAVATDNDLQIGMSGQVRGVI